MRYLEADYQGEEILTGRQGALGLIALNRPRVLNSLSHDMILAFGKALDAFEADPQVAAVLVTGEANAGFAPAATSGCSMKAARPATARPPNSSRPNTA